MTTTINDMQLHTISFYFLLFISSVANAQETTAYRSGIKERITISSAILKEDRIIYIHHPVSDSAASTKRYPVLYLFDGESHFDMLAQYTDYLSRWDVAVMPEMIVVGIVNTQRTRDLTPVESNIDYYGKTDTSSVSWMKPSGGNGLLLQFISSELMPYMDAHYKTAAHKILAGHSFGGIATLNCMLTRPDMFDAYIAASPSLWWGNEYILKLADSKLSKGSTLHKQLFYCDANEGAADSTSFHTNLLRFDSLVKSKNIQGLSRQYTYYPSETHMTSPMPAYYDALRFIYREWKPAVEKQ